MNVLSLFDGISCGRVALERAGIDVEKYYASEINQDAIKVTQTNYPDTIQLGDVGNWRDWDVDYKNIDLIIGGSPCQGFSIAGRKLNFQDERSKLFFIYVEILNECRKVNPNVKFLLENVRMPSNIANEISRILGVDYVFINSVYFTGQVRKRFYWTNIKLREKTPNNNICLKDVIDNSIIYDRDCEDILNRTQYSVTKSVDGIITINPKDKNGKQTWQRGRIYDIKGKCTALCATLFDLNITEDHVKYRKLTISECERLQGLPIGYTSILPKNKAGEAIGNGWTVDVIAHIFKGLNNQ